MMTEKSLSRKFIEMKGDYKNKRRQKQRELKQLSKEFELDKKALVKEAKDIRRSKNEKKQIKTKLIEALPERHEDEQEIVRQSIAAQFSTFKGAKDD